MAVVGIDLFAGAGGLSLGAATAGVRIDVAIEWDPRAAMTYQRNHLDTRVLVEDVTQLDSVSAGVPTNNPVFLCCQGLASFALPPAIKLEWSISTMNEGAKMGILTAVAPKNSVRLILQGVMPFGKAEACQKATKAKTT